MLFLDLPIELLPEILEHVIKPQHLASACLVDKTFRSFATPRLYDRISIYSWHREGKVKVIKLFDTLSRHPYLANLLHKLEIRDFPKAITLLDGDILHHVQRGLRNCTGLRACTWTRDGSLNSEILEALVQCPNLRDLELNGHNDGHYDPRLLLQFRNLNRISLIMPSTVVVSQLGTWLSFTGHTLRNFTLICKASTIITDSLLESIAPYLVNLDHLNLTGCPKVTHRGVWALVSPNVDGLVGLGLEGVSPKFDMKSFASQCTKSGVLKRLRSVTLTVQQQVPMKEWISGIYSTGAFFESPLTDDLWSKLILMHGTRLVRFSIHRMLISLEAIQNICVKCVNLEQLFVVVEPSSLVRFILCRKLRTVHINYPLEAFMDAYPVLRPDQALSVIDRCSSSITQFGCNARVWQVERKIVVDDQGALQAHRTLAPYGSPDVPEQFLVVRT
ncbi:hypothetical protein CPB84DRAFT_1814867 [Gymnopilus junonius]|uniref:F-box domain-containing protein n=1 Tax=Gymnopilus junonius TaxID=109634 RepID=A0A9P5TP33_GYMJU|nr:hypothetical protein CPB84DRAFT_1814867 [Gymnopilus junonius]